MWKNFSRRASLLTTLSGSHFIIFLSVLLFYIFFIIPKPIALMTMLIWKIAIINIIRNMPWDFQQKNYLYQYIYRFLLQSWSRFFHINSRMTTAIVVNVVFWYSKLLRTKWWDRLQRHFMQPAKLAFLNRKLYELREKKDNYNIAECPRLSIKCWLSS